MLLLSTVIVPKLMTLLIPPQEVRKIHGSTLVRVHLKRN